MQFLSKKTEVFQAKIIKRSLKNGRFLALSGFVSILAACKPNNPSETDYLNVVKNTEDPNAPLVLLRWNSSSNEKAIPTIIFYKFNENSAEGNYSEGATEVNFKAFSEGHRDVARKIIEDASNQFGVTFIEIAPDDDSVTVNILIEGNLHMDGNIGGYANYPGRSGNITIKLDADSITDSFKQIFYHELGHALGLKHPFSDGGPLDAATDSDYVASQTVMSYFHNANATKFLDWDVDALTHLYGTKKDEAITYKYENSMVTINGTDKDDIFAGSTLNDIIFAGDGNDIVFSSYGDDEIYGGKGDDFLHGGAGSNKLYGEQGDDLLVYTHYALNNIFDGGEGIDTVSAEDWGYNSNINLTSSKFNAVENIIGSAFNDTLYGDDKTNVINAGKGDDTIYSSAGTDSIIGGDGQDKFVIYTTSVVYSIQKDVGKISLSYLENGNNRVSELQSVEAIELITNISNQVDIASIWSDLTQADKTVFEDNSTNFDDWLVSDYGYESIA